MIDEKMVQTLSAWCELATGRGQLASTQKLLEAIVKYFLGALYEAGVSGFSAGHHPARVRFLLPGPIMEEKHLDFFEKSLREALKKTAENKL